MGTGERQQPRATDNAGLLLGSLRPGDRIGDYAIDAQLPTRGSGHRYLASHLLLARRAILTVMPSGVGASRDLAIELLREAALLDSVDHPGVPRLFETGMLADRRPWTAVEHVDGGTLVTHAVADHALIALVRDVADILATIHAHGLVHANVVPAAIVIPARPRRHPLCLVDWGAARTLDSERPLPLAPPLGSVAYLAPEQLRGEPLTGRADVCALGRIARALGGRRGGELAPLFVALVDRMVDPDPAQRPSSAEVRDLTAWLAMPSDADPVSETIRIP